MKKEMATHCRILAWKIPWTEEPGSHKQSDMTEHICNNSLKSSRWHSGKENSCQSRRCKRRGFNPWVGKSLQERNLLCSPVFREGTGDPLQYSCLENPMDGGAWQAAVHGVAKSRTRLSDFTFTFHFHALRKEMATDSSVLCWRIPVTGEPGGLPSMGSHESDTTDVTQQQQQSVFLPGNSLRARSLVSYSPKGHKESDMTY